MQQEIARHIRQVLLGTPGISKFGALVETVNTTENIPDKAKAQSFPASQDVLPKPAGNGPYYELTPNSNEAGIVYFEHMSLTSGGVESGGLSFTSKLRLVCWQQAVEASQPLGAQAILQAYVLRRLAPLSRSHNVAGLAARIQVTPGKLLTREDKLFSRYTYNEAQRQYLLAPYGAFGIELTTTFVVPLACLPAEPIPTPEPEPEPDPEATARV